MFPIAAAAAAGTADTRYGGGYLNFIMSLGSWEADEVLGVTRGGKETRSMAKEGEIKRVKKRVILSGEKSERERIRRDR